MFGKEGRWRDNSKSGRKLPLLLTTDNWHTFGPILKRIVGPFSKRESELSAQTDCTFKRSNISSEHPVGANQAPSNGWSRSNSPRGLSNLIAKLTDVQPKHKPHTLANQIHTHTHSYTKTITYWIYPIGWCTLISHPRSEFYLTERYLEEEEEWASWDRMVNFKSEPAGTSSTYTIQLHQRSFRRVNSSENSTQ